MEKRRAFVSLVSLTKRTVVIVFTTLLILLIGFLIFYAFELFLLIFAAILLAALFRGASGWISQKFSIKETVPLVAVIVFFFMVVIGFFWFMIPQISDQSKDMKASLKSSMEKVKKELNKYGWGQDLVEKSEENPQSFLKKGDLWSKAKGIFSGTLNTLVNILLIIVVGIFLAIDPALYKKGVVRLFPVKKRPRISEVLSEVFHTLKLWLFAKLLSMLLLGVLTYIGLVALGMPLAFILAVIAGALAFIPNIGPYLSVVPALLVALTEGTEMVLYVALLYFGIQMIESYLLTPIIYKKMVSIPPALTLTFQVLMGILAGGFGLLLASPIVAVLLVIVKELYVKDGLESETE